MFEKWVGIVIKIVGILSGVATIVEFIRRKDRRKFVVFFLVFVTVGCVSYFLAKQKGVKETIVEDITEATNSVEEFVPDYTPGNEKIRENSTYINNFGCLAVQDQKIYISTQNCILKMNSDSTHIENVLDVNARNLNVLGDWIYYSKNNGIYKVRTDGDLNQQILDVTMGVYKMIVNEKGIYFINREDMKLYFMCVDGTKVKRVLEDPIIAFCFARNGCLIYTTVELQYDVEGNENGYRTQSLYAMDMDKNKTLIMTYKMGEFGAVDEAPIDLCEYGMDIIYCNYFGLFRVDGINYSITKLSNVGGTFLCVENGKAYYSGSLPSSSSTEMSMGNIICVDLQNGDVSNLGKPFEENGNVTYIYPVNGNIIISYDRSEWYSYTDGKLEFLFNINDIQ